MTMTQADRSSGPARPRRRSFTAEQKAEFVGTYDATPNGDKGAFLRRNGLYYSHIVKWRAQHARDAQRAAAKRTDEVARLKNKVSELEAELAASQRTVSTLGKAFELLEHISKSSEPVRRPGRF